MTKSEVQKLLMILTTTYPNFKIDNKLEAVEIWHDMLAEYDSGLVFAALKSSIKENKSGFAPSIGEIIGKIEIIQPIEINLPNEQEAWALVSKALRRSTYYAEEEYAQLPEVVQEAVGNASNLRNWAQTDIESIENVIASNFQRTYRTVARRHEEVARLPLQARQLHEQIKENGRKGIGVNA